MFPPLVLHATRSGGLSVRQNFVTVSIFRNLFVVHAFTDDTHCMLRVNIDSRGLNAFERQPKVSRARPERKALERGSMYGRFSFALDRDLDGPQHLDRSFYQR